MLSFIWQIHPFDDEIYAFPVTNSKFNNISLKLNTGIIHSWSIKSGEIKAPKVQRIFYAVSYLTRICLNF